jgi:hypothetical protein
MNLSAGSWQDLQVAAPIDPKSVLQYATLGVTLGSFTRSTTVLQAAWVASTIAPTGNNTKVMSLDTTDAATTADANQWTFTHQMTNAAAAIPSAMNKVMFLRAGKIWDNQIELAFGGSTYDSVQLTFRDNLGTTGQFLNSATGAVPVINFGNGHTGNKVMHLSIITPGTYSVVLVMVTGGNWSAYEMEWIVLP